MAFIEKIAPFCVPLMITSVLMDISTGGRASFICTCYKLAIVSSYVVYNICCSILHMASLTDSHFLRTSFIIDGLRFLVGRGVLGVDVGA
jgi:hypothetical protein